MNTSSANIIITGGKGQVAHALMQQSRHYRYQFIACAHEDLDITNVDSIKKAMEKYNPIMIINAAAYTAVDKAEQERDLATCVNQTGAENIARTCDEHQIPLIHLSTDYIFDGAKSSPYVEDDTPSPISHYGKSKWLGEEAVREFCPNHLILRTSGIFSSHGNNFYNTMQKLSRLPQDIRVVNDQVTCPTAASDIADTINTLIAADRHWGTYHFCSSLPVSWHGFAEAILHKPIIAISTAEYPTAAKRPMNAVLNCQKIAATYNIKQPSWERAVWTMQ